MTEQSGKWVPGEGLATFSDLDRFETSVVATEAEQMTYARLQDHPALASYYLKQRSLRVINRSESSPNAPTSINSWRRPGIGRRTSLQSRLIYLARVVVESEQDSGNSSNETGS